MEAIKTIVNKVSVPSEKKTKQKEYLPKGTLPIIDQGQMLIGGYTNDTSKTIVCDLPVIVFGDHTCCVKYIDFPFGAGADGIKVIKPKEGALPKYLYYGIQYLVIRISNRGYGRHYQHIEKMFLNVPSISQQKQIVSQIEEQLSQLDSAVETLKKTKQQLEVYRQAVLKEAFSGNLTKKWRDDNKEEWSIVNILSLVKHEKNALKAGPFGSALKKSFYVSVGYKVYGQEQVIAGDESIGDYFINELKYKELYNCRVKPHDVLISLVGTVGKVLILSDNCKAGIINPRLIKVSLDENVYLPKFFKYYFESSYLKSLYKLKTHGATMDVLNMGMIKELPFPLCSIDEQKQIIKEIETRYSLCDNIEQTVNQSLQQAEALRQSILKQAFEG